MAYIAKKDTWFKEGSEVELITDCGELGGIFKGILVNEETGEEYQDQELCPWEEFDISLKDGVEANPLSATI
jgi:hypothetical protein